MAPFQIVLISILLIGLVQGQYDNGYQRAFGGPDEDEGPSQDQSVYSSDDSIPRSPKFDVYRDYEGGRNVRQGDEATLPPIINWSAARQRFLEAYRNLREKLRGLREQARELGNELKER